MLEPKTCPGETHCEAKWQCYDAYCRVWAWLFENLVCLLLVTDWDGMSTMSRCHDVTWQFRSHAVCDPKFGKEISKLPRIQFCLNQTGPRYVWLWVSTRSFRASHTTRLCHVSIEEFDNLCSLMLDLRMRFPTCACFQPNNTPFWRAHCTVLELSTVVLSIETYEDVACLLEVHTLVENRSPSCGLALSAQRCPPNVSNNLTSRSNALNRSCEANIFSRNSAFILKTKPASSIIWSVCWICHTDPKRIICNYTFIYSLFVICYSQTCYDYTCSIRPEPGCSCCH